MTNLHILMRDWRGVAVVLAILLSALSSGWCQQAQLSGFIKDSTGAVIPGATVNVVSLTTGDNFNTQSNDAGIYTFAVLSPGTYRMTAEARGFRKSVVENVVLDVAGKVNLNIVLTVGSTQDVVTVNGSALAINMVDASVSTVVDRQFVENVPLNGRSFQSLLTTVPGVVVVPSVAVGASGTGAAGEISVNGQRTEQNYFTVDGISVNTGAPAASAIGFGAGFSGAAPAETMLGTTQSMVSIDALQEFRATTSTYSAEYGRTPGGQFSLNTRSGTNQFHGLLFNYLRNGALDANNWFNNNLGVAKPIEQQNDFGGTLGGPLTIPGLYNGKDKTFFFFSYEGLRLRNPVAATLTQVPSEDLRQNAPVSLQPILNAFPVSSLPDNGDGTAYFTASYSAPGSIDTTAIRVDHNINDRFRIFGRYSTASSSTSVRNVGNLAENDTFDGTVRYVTLGATNLFTPRFSNDLRFNVTYNNQDFNQRLTNFGGATPFALSDLQGLNDQSQFSFYMLYGLFSYYGVGPQSTRQQQINVVDNMNMSLGRHNVKWGFDFRRIRTREPLPPVSEQGWYFDADGILADQLGGSNLFHYPVPMNPVYTNYSFYGQDEWKVAEGLSLSFGLRWDINPAPGDTEGNLPYTVTTTDLATAEVAPRGTPLWKTTYGNLAPRFGFAYQLSNASGHETVLRAGTGLFYDAVNTVASNGYYGLGFAGGGSFSGVSFPFSQADIGSLPPPSITTPYEAVVFGFDPHLKLPYSWQWNFAIEQGLGDKQTLTLNYVGSAGRRLLAEKEYTPFIAGNNNFDEFTALRLATNSSFSNYHSLQARFERRLSHGLQVLASYTWSHSTDEVSNNSLITEDLYADSDFDIRHNFQVGLTADLPGRFQNKVLAVALSHWAFDLRLSARSALPVDVVGGATIDPVTTTSITYHPNRIAGVPLYVHDSTAPDGRAINIDAYSVATDSTGNLIEGNAGRNSARGFNAVQADVAVRKDFVFTSRLALQFRAEAFNVFNHANFGSIYNDVTLGPGLFGWASNTQNSQLGALNPLYQMGGPRSLQLALRLHF